MAMLEYVVLPAGLETIEPYGISKVGFPVDGGTPEKPVSVYRIDVFYKGDEDGWDAVDKEGRRRKRHADQRVGRRLLLFG